MPYKAIVQARQERRLVEAFLRRYARGEDGAYHRYLDGGQGDEPYLVGGKYPGVYYRPVRVCSNCHMVYTLLDEARARALRTASRTCAGGHKESPIAAEETVPAVSASSEGHEFSSLAVSLSEARRAMDVISQGDISELRSLVRPPAAVVHVASIALLLLEGKTTEKDAAVPNSWAIARAAMCRADLLPRLRALDPRAVTPQHLSSVGPALERSSLDPAVVRPLCNAAGNLCLWILGVIQANRDQDDAVGATSVAPAASSDKQSPCRRKKNLGGRVAAQAFTSGRLANAGQCEAPEASSGKHFVCSDGRTRLPYRVCGNSRTSSGIAESCNFVVVHDFFDNVDKTEVLFRPVTRKHRGCRVLAFSYPGQAGTVFRVPPTMAALAKEVPNNAFLAPRLHELLQHVHSVGEMSLTAPFHLVGIGNGMATAAAFALRYGDHPLYRSSIRSVVSINGFSSVDSQLAAILHSSLNAFATLPPARPDLPVSFMSR
ncbi:unnamed protein product [Ectocarpus sp. 12 AP-2014]